MRGTWGDGAKGLVGRAVRFRYNDGMRKLAPKVLCVAVGAWLCWPTAPAYGQDSAASEALFHKGVAEMEVGRYGTACPALAESQRLDPRAGTLFTLAECEAKGGKIATALAHYSDYVGLVSQMAAAESARHRDRAAIAQAQIERLRPQVPHLTIVVPSGAPKGIVVKRNGVALMGVSLGMALPVDPGEHAIVTRLPGGQERTQKVTVRLGESKRVQVEVPAALGSESGPAREASGERESPSATPTGVYVAGGVGAVGVVVGTVTGLMAMSKKETVDDNCSGSVCNSDGKSAADSGMRLGTVSTVGFGVGAASLVTAVVVWLSAPDVVPEETGRQEWWPVVGSSDRAATIGMGGTW